MNCLTSSVIVIQFLCYENSRRSTFVPGLWYCDHRYINHPIMPP